METTRVGLRVAPGAGKPGVVGRYGSAWKLRVSEPPEGGRANEAAVKLLARTLALPRGQVRLVAGHGARDKVVEVTGIGPEQIDERLAAAEAERRR